MNDTARAALTRQLDATPTAPAPRTVGPFIEPAAVAFRRRVLNRYGTQLLAAERAGDLDVVDVCDRFTSALLRTAARLTA